MSTITLRQTLLAALLCCQQLQAQEPPPADLLYLGPVCILFYAEHRYAEPGDKQTIVVSPGLLRLKMGVLPPNLPSLAVVQTGDRPMLQYHHVMRLQVLGLPHKEHGWMPLCSHASPAECETEGPDHEWQIESDSAYLLRFGLADTDSVLLEITLIGRWASTEMEGWREVNEPDPMVVQLPPVSRVRAQTPDKAFFTMPETDIRAQRARFIQFVMKPAPPWADSIWEYSWSPLGNEQHQTWQPSGRLLTLPYGNNHQYILKLRTRGQPGYLEYNILSEPAWYQRPTLMVLLGLVLLLFSGLLFFWWKQYRLKKVVESQSALTSLIMGMQSSLGPHTMMNALAALHSMIDGRQWEQAQHYCSELGSLLKHSLAKHVKVYSMLNDELQEIREYVRLQKLKLPFQYVERLENPEWPGQLEVPTGLLLPLVENAVKYNFSPGDGLQYLYIDMHAEGATLCVTIRSLGRPPAIPITMQRPKPSAGFGLPWVNNRISLHNKIFPKEPITFRHSNDAYKSEARFEFGNKLNTLA